MIGRRDDKLFKGATTSANEYGIKCELLSSDEIKKRFPAFKPSPDTVALLEENAGILFPEDCINAQLELAKKGDVQFHFNEAVTGIRSERDHVEIITDRRKYITQKIIASAGAWMSSLLPELKLPLTVKRQVLFWFRCDDADQKKFSVGNLPVFLWEYEKNKIFYGFPDLGNGIKIAIHHEGKITTAGTINRIVDYAEINELEHIMKRYFNAKVSFSHSAVCMYTNTPDEHFIIDYHPSNQNIILASPCSGHGFKFSSAIGKILSEMVLEKPLSFDMAPFRLARFV